MKRRKSSWTVGIRCSRCGYRTGIKTRTSKSLHLKCAKCGHQKY